MLSLVVLHILRVNLLLLLIHYFYFILFWSDSFWTSCFYHFMYRNERKRVRMLEQWFCLQKWHTQISGQHRSQMYRLGRTTRGFSPFYPTLLIVFLNLVSSLFLANRHLLKNLARHLLSVSILVWVLIFLCIFIAFLSEKLVSVPLR